MTEFVSAVLLPEVTVHLKIADMVAPIRGLPLKVVVADVGLEMLIVAPLTFDQR